MKDNGHGDRDDFEELRRLLLGDELEKLERLNSKIEVPENFSDQVGEILPRAMRKSSEHGEELSQAMVPTVEEIVRLSIKKDINRFADALFPVIGPAIRKSIRETIRQMLQTLNRTLEQSLSWQGLRWRLQSLRTGIPFAQIALLHGLVYRVEQVFLIHRETGLLLHHLAEDAGSKQNADLVSSMLSAINDFVGDSFAVETDRSLNSIEIGELSIWLEVGPHAILAVAIRGEAPNSLRTTLQQSLERIQAELGETLIAFCGDTDAFTERDDLLQDCLQARYHSRRAGISAKTVIVLLLLILALGYWIVLEWRQHSLRDAYVDSLAAEPGYVVTAVESERGILRVAGLRDPLARSPEQLLAESALTDEEVRHAFAPYQSLDAGFVAQRAQRILAPPNEVSLEIDGRRLRVGGVADLAWRDRMRSLLPLIAGIDTYDESGLRLLFTPALLDPPAGVSMRLEQGTLYVEGAAEQDWIAVVADAADAYAEIERVDLRALVNLTEAALVSEIEVLEKQAVFFDVATSFDFDSIDAPRLGAMVKNIIALADNLSRNVLIVVRGYSDSVGSFEDNAFLSRERADFVAQALFNTGINPRYIAIKGLEAEVEVEASAAERRFNRRVGFEVIVE